MTKRIRAVDLFCGAGGTSSGLKLACDDLGLELDLLAVNHWATAIETHSANHPQARHICADLETIDPRLVVPGGKLDILCASPECTFHSRARGGRPITDQKRVSAWQVVRWAEALYIRNILIENVREFADWAPIGANGRPMKSRRGETFRAFIQALTSLGYTVEFRVLNCADYGDPTSRERLFILARRGRRVAWPEPTHSRSGGETLFGQVPKWRAAREIIDWNLPAESIFSRKKPLSENTVKRIVAGLRKFCGMSFVVNIRGGKDGYLRASSVEEPVPAITTHPPIALVEPFLITMEHSKASPDQGAHDVNRPIPTIVANGDAWGLVEPFLVEYHGSTYPGGERVRSVEQPMPVVATSNQFGLVQPFLVKYYGSGVLGSVDEPRDTVTARDRFGLVIPGLEGCVLDIRFRMLQPHELAQAMSFDPEYEFAGTREEKVRQIGNAVPVQTARALSRSLLE